MYLTNRMFKIISEFGCKKKIIFVLGPPGSGKGTQSANIANTFNFRHIAVGHLLREQVKLKTKHGELINNHLKNGTIVPVNITSKIIKKHIAETDCDKFLIDGFPRDLNNLLGWNNEMKDFVEILFVLHLKCSYDVCFERCLQRSVKGAQRSDDNESTIEKRMHLYNCDTKAVIDHFKSKDLVKSVNADHSIAEVFEEIKQIFNECNLEL